jgi:hypothetical protein
VREFFAGALVGTFWGALGLTVFFLPDYLIKFRQDNQLEPWFWGTALTLLGVFALCLAAKRAFGSQRWLFGDAWARQEVVGMLGGTGVGLEVPLSSISDVLVSTNGGRVKLKLLSGQEVLVARSWFGKAELDEVRARILAEVRRA